MKNIIFSLLGFIIGFLFLGIGIAEASFASIDYVRITITYSLPHGTAVQVTQTAGTIIQTSGTVVQP